MEEDFFFSIDTPSMGLYKEKGSKFLSFAVPITDEADAKVQISSLIKEYYDARHHCYAYILGADKELFRLSDDGEPSGTAGRPIHGQLLSFNVTNILLLVVRYFGGIKLGTSGLAQAYKAAAKDAMENATIVKKYIQEYYHTDFPFPATNKVMNLLARNQTQILSQTFTDKVSLTFSIRKSLAANLSLALQNIQGVEVEKISHQHAVCR